MRLINANFRLRLIGWGQAPPLLLSLALLFLIFGCAGVRAQNRIAILLKAETTIEKDQIELSDIAEFKADAANLARLKTVSLGYAPQPGATREIFKEKIALAIAAAGFAANAIVLDCPPKILIRRAAQKISLDLLRETMEKAVLTKFQTENVTARIIVFDAPENIEVPSGAVSIKTDLANVHNFFAPFAAAIEISVDNRVVRRVSANVKVAASANVFVAAKNLTAQDKIVASDFRIETRLLEKPLQNYVRNAEQLRGTVLLKNLATGDELTTNSIVAGSAVRNGDLVRIISQSGKLQISVTGEARASGRIGDRIAVKNSTSQAILQATIIDQGLVKINF